MGPPFGLRSDHQRAVFDERPVVDEVRHVLPGGASSASATSLDRLRASIVGAECTPGQHVGEILSIESLGAGIDRCCELAAGVAPWAQSEHRIARMHRGADLDEDRTNDARGRREHVVMQLHGLDERQRRSGGHRAADLHLDRHDRALEFG